MWHISPLDCWLPPMQPFRQKGSRLTTCSSRTQACYKICAVRTPVPDSSSTEAGTATSAGTGAVADKQASQLLTDADVAAAQAAPGGALHPS